MKVLIGFLLLFVSKVSLSSEKSEYLLKQQLQGSRLLYSLEVGDVVVDRIKNCVTQEMDFLNLDKNSIVFRLPVHPEYTKNPLTIIEDTNYLGTILSRIDGSYTADVDYSNTVRRILIGIYVNIEMLKESYLDMDTILTNLEKKMFKHHYFSFISNNSLQNEFSRFSWIFVKSRFENHPFDVVLQGVQELVGLTIKSEDKVKEILKRFRYSWMIYVALNSNHIDSFTPFQEKVEDYRRSFYLGLYDYYLEEEDSANKIFILKEVVSKYEKSVDPEKLAIGKSILLERFRKNESFNYYMYPQYILSWISIKIGIWNLGLFFILILYSMNLWRFILTIKNKTVFSDCKNIIRKILVNDSDIDWNIRVANALILLYIGAMLNSDSLNAYLAF